MRSTKKYAEQVRTKEPQKNKMAWLSVDIPGIDTIDGGYDQGLDERLLGKDE